MSRLSASSALLAASCLMALAVPVALPAQTVQGMVFEEATGLPVSGASINVLTSDFVEVARGVTDALGLFELAMPDTGTFLVTASLTGYVASAPKPVTLAPNQGTTVMLAIRSLRPDSVRVAARESEDGGYAADIYGQVLENVGGQPIQNAEVRLIGRSGSVTTGSNGRFAIRDADPGPVRLYFQHLSYSPREIHVDLQPGVAYEVAVRMEVDPVEIPGIEVTAVSRLVARRLEPVYQRMDRAVTAHFRTDKDFAARGHPPVGSLLRGLPRVKVQNRGLTWSVTMGGAVTLNGDACVPSIYLDGMRVSRHGDPASLSEFLAMSTFDVAIIEVYPGAASLPPEFNDPGTMCAIGIWTKRGGS